MQHQYIHKIYSDHLHILLLLLIFERMGVLILMENDNIGILF